MCKRLTEMTRDYTRSIREAVNLLAQKCPRLVASCYWAGTGAISVEELGHRQSFDLDFHTRKALQDVRPLQAEMAKAFPGGFELIHASDEYGSGFKGLLSLPSGEKITVEVLSNYEDVSDTDLVASQVGHLLKRVSLLRYLADKVQCIVERSEARDLVDIAAVLHRHPELEEHIRRLLAEQDELMVVERLLGWTDASIVADLTAYTDVDPSQARDMRDQLLTWIRSADRSGSGT